MTNSQKYFDPETLSRIRPLGLRAHTLVEGLVAGLHRSPLRGHSIEFAQHREYVPGDDLRQVDWKVYARSDRHYLKQYEDETNLVCYMLVDQSQSMTYQGSQSHLSKLEYAQLVACSLSYLVTSQQDSAGLITFDTEIADWLPASSSPTQLEDMIRILEAGKHNEKTSIAHVLREVLQRLGRPSLLVLVSDLFDTVENLTTALRMVRQAGHDLILVQILDRDEIEFPFDQMANFTGLEALPEVLTDPLMIAGAYRRAMVAFQQQIQDLCQQAYADYFPLRTDESLASSLPEFLAKRLARRS